LRIGQGKKRFIPQRTTVLKTQQSRNNQFHPTNGNTIFPLSLLSSTRLPRTASTQETKTLRKRREQFNQKKTIGKEQNKKRKVRRKTE